MLPGEKSEGKQSLPGKELRQGQLEALSVNLSSCTVGWNFETWLLSAASSSCL